MKGFFDKVYEAVSRIPKGRVATYGQIAAMVSTPRASRAVGLALSKLSQSSKIPWHRVISGKGIITIENLSVPKKHQAERLQKEGVKVIFKDGNYCVNLQKYFWNAGIV